jgi:transcription elongation factor GreA
VSGGESITAEGLAALKEELADLEGRGRREIAEKIKRARELGDLSENAEYHQSKEQQAHLETKIARLTERLRNARVVEAADSGVVSFGIPFTATDLGSGRQFAWTIVGATEADAKAGRLSAESPVAQALLEQAPGDEVVVTTPGGEKRFRIDAIG